MSRSTPPSKVRHNARMLELVLYQRVLHYPKRVTCGLCGWSGPQFAPMHDPRRPNRSCPICRSTERYRAIELYLRARGPVPPGTRFLEVAPISRLRAVVESLGYEYTSVDLQSPRAAVHADLCRLPYADATFSLVICFHVLEHIVDDASAVKELGRVVGAEGEAIVIVPRDNRRPDTFEVPTTSPEERVRLFGQADHVRIYGADLLDRWHGFAPEVAIAEQRWVDEFSPEEHRRSALAGNDDRFWVFNRP